MKIVTYNAWITLDFCMQVARNKFAAWAKFPRASSSFTMKGLARKKWSMTSFHGLFLTFHIHKVTLTSCMLLKGCMYVARHMYHALVKY